MPRHSIKQRNYLKWENLSGTIKKDIQGTNTMFTQYFLGNKGPLKERLSLGQPGEWIKSIKRDHRKGTSKKAPSRRGRIIEESSRSKGRDLTVLSFNPFMCIMYPFIQSHYLDDKAFGYLNP